MAIEQVKAALGEPLFDDSDQLSAEFDGVHPDADAQQIWRCTKYDQMKPVAGSGLVAQASVGIRFCYRTGNMKVWSVEVMDPTGAFDFCLGGLPSHPTFAECSRLLGEPLERLSQTPVLDMVWWKKGDLMYRAEVFSTDYPDLLRHFKKDELQTVHIYSTSLAPLGFDAGLAYWKRNQPK